jgi:23S rRNA (adenine2030-N6)-methyltransferase
VLGPDAWLTLVERDADTRDALARAVGDDPNARIVAGDGLAELPRALAVAADTTVALVDPPWTQKADWLTVPDAVARAATTTTATLVLWYPVKSLTRPNAMLARLEGAGVDGTIAELVTTPLAHQRSRLNGSGVLLVRPPVGVLEALAAAAPVLGRTCATHGGAWSFRMQAFGERRRTPGSRA